MAYCTKCGVEVTEDAEFCGGCGTRVPTSGEDRAVGSGQPTPAARAKRRNARLIVAAVVAVLVLMAGGIAVLGVGRLRAAQAEDSKAAITTAVWLTKAAYASDLAAMGKVVAPEALLSLGGRSGTWQSAEGQSGVKDELSWWRDHSATFKLTADGWQGDKYVMEFTDSWFPDSPIVYRWTFSGDPATSGRVRVDGNHAGDPIDFRGWSIVLDTAARGGSRVVTGFEYSDGESYAKQPPKP